MVQEQEENRREYVDISRFSDERLDHFGQIPKGRRKDFHLEPNYP